MDPKTNLQKYALSQARVFARDIYSERWGGNNNQSSPQKIALGPTESNVFAHTLKAVFAGKLVLAIELDTDDPKDAADRLAALFMDAYKRYRRKTLVPKTFWKSWLEVICEFEKSEVDRRASGHKKYWNQPKRHLFQKLIQSLIL